MLIDPLSIKWSPKRGFSTMAADQLNFIEGWKILLASVGWTLKASVKASATIGYPLGVPIVDGGTQSPKQVVGCNTFVTIGSTTFTLYDPGRQVPASLAPCVFVPMDITASGTLANLCSQITASTSFDATFAAVGPNSFEVFLTAKIGGPIGNGVLVLGDGRFGEGSGSTFGGGYKLESAAGASIYQCQLTLEKTFPGGLQFLFTLNGTPAVYLLQSQGEPNSGPVITQCSILANGYGFCVFDGPEGVTGAPYRSCVLFAQAPYIPRPGDPDLPNGETYDTSAYAVFVLGTGFRNQTVWYLNVTTCLDSYANSYSNSGGWPRLLAIRSAGAPLITPAFRALVIGAYVMFGQGPTSGAALVGKLWDCAVIHDQVSDSMIMGQRFIPVSSQASSGGSLTTTLMWAIPPAVTHKSGTVTTVNSPPGKASVFLVGGQDFSGLNAGDPITIDGIPNVIDAITDSAALTVVNPIVPPLTSVGYTVP